MEKALRRQPNQASAAKRCGDDWASEELASGGLSGNLTALVPLSCRPGAIGRERPVLSLFYIPIAAQRPYGCLTRPPQEWMYYLNEGSRVSISYTINSHASSPLVLVIAQGEESLRRWTEDPMFPASALSWNLMNGTGLVRQKILKSSDYYIAVGNLNPMPVEVHLDFVVDALLYNTSGALCKCSLLHSSCVMKLLFLQANAAVLATSVVQQSEDGHGLFFKLSYNPRWSTYIFGSVLMSAMILLALKVLNHLHYNPQNSQAAEAAPERAPLLSNKDADGLSLGSSYESVSSDENNPEEHLLDPCQNEAGVSRRGKESNSHCLCTICLDVARDCFFIPCGHCAVCFTCGTRVLEDGGTCPACRRRIKKVKKIFTI